MSIIKKYPNVIKRSGEEVEFNEENIYNAIKKANEDKEYVDEIHMLSEIQIRAITENVCNIIAENGYAISVESIQDIVEKEISNMRAHEVAKAYILYRYQHAMQRDFMATDFVQNIMNIVEQDETGKTKNSEAKTENANKDVTLDSTQRDYIAGFVSKKISEHLFEAEAVKAHNKGIIHIHDTDYFIQKMFNC
ncbi:MAG: anaerobic ribonucleoside-triphosphate reductase, partial [Lachnospiraceae bacterium]|nr:anaerobic ribonucleoside-triphosphate reductase [Lachnospiraceae bacterium]